jgi:PIN domain nuclease of toxin-antitoxin system
MLSRAAATLIADPGNTVLVSAASAWEISTKVRLGRLPEAERLESDFAGWVERAGYVARGVTLEDGIRAGRFVAKHQDPWDRMIAAQAIGDGIPVISVDAKLDEFGVRRIW